MFNINLRGLHRIIYTLIKISDMTPIIRINQELHFAHRCMDNNRLFEEILQKNDQLVHDSH